MINLEQVKLLETKVGKAIEYVERLVRENTALRRQEAELQAKLESHQKKIDELEVLETELQTRLESYQKRIDELEVLVVDFKEDQGQIEEGILAALDRLSQFEKAIEKSLKDRPAGTKAAKSPQTAAAKTAPEQDGSGEGQTCFEIPEAATADETPGGDIPDPLNADTAPAESGELDIF